MFEKIINYLESNQINFQLIDHEPVFTSEAAAKVRGVGANEGTKSLLLKTKNGFLLLVIPGDKRLDSKKVRANLNVKDFRFAYPEEVKSMMSCEIGACYPFGNLINIEMVVDKTFENNDYIAMNPGVHNKTIRMKWLDFQKLINPKMEDLCK